MKKIVLTGAAGRLGSYLREPLSKMADHLVSSDIIFDPGKLYQGESYERADLANYDEIHALLKGADMVVHFGAHPDEASFKKLLGPNFIGAYNIWEAAFQNGVRRVIYASSIHAVGMYWDKRQVEAVCLRIISCAQVNTARGLGTWLSYDDLIRLVTSAVTTPITGFSIVYGVSNNDRVGVDNSKAAFLGYRPQDNAEIFAAKILNETPALDVNDKAHMCHGGPFASVPLGTSGMAQMNIINDKKNT
jgi:uronate dehydrogenase